MTETQGYTQGRNEARVDGGDETQPARGFNPSREQEL